MIRDLHRIIQLVEGEWRKTRVLIVGDLMLDRYIWGDVERISPEAPVPVVRAGYRSDQAGGAGNVAMNISALGANATLLGFRGDDDDGEALERALQRAGIRSQAIVVPEHPTTTKLRIVGGKQQMLRLDTERTDGYPDEFYAALLSKLEPAIADANVVMLSDYAKGTLNAQVCRRAIEMARRAGVPVLVDPKQPTFDNYRGATTICPNLAELSLVTGVSSKNLEALLPAAQKLVTDLDVEYLTVTLSEKGIALLRGDSQFIAPAVARQVFDVSGAGDTVIATLALAAAAELEVEIAVELANLAAGIVVGKVGTVPVTRDELLMSLMPQIELQAQEKVLSLDSLVARAAAWRSAGQSLAFTNGCFDLLHIGHITLLEQARREGDRLVVGINSDASVRGLKGPTRPIVSERERARILAALAAVDAVVIFEEATPLRVVETLRPDVIVKGGDYNEENIVGAKEVRSWGGRVKIVPIVKGFSTTNLIVKALAPSLD